MRPPMYAGLSLSLTGTSATGQRPIFVPVTSVSHSSARQLRIVVAAVARGLAHARRHAGPLQREHQLVGVARSRPPGDQRIERVLVREPRRERREARIARPLRMPGHFDERAPLGVGEAGDRDPAIVAGARIDVVRRRRLVRRAIAVARPDASVGRPVEDRWCR